MLLFKEKIINISLTKEKKNWLTCEVKVLQNFDATMLITKYYCLSQDVVTSDANHNFFDRVLLVLFSWWSPDSKLVSLWTRILQYSSSGVLLPACFQIPHLNKNCFMQLLCHGSRRKWRHFMIDYQNIFLLLYFIRKCWKNKQENGLLKRNG